MTTVTKRQTTAMATGAKKALAIVATGALVASLGYFHLWGSTPAVAANDGDQVEVFFNLDNDVTVEVGNEKFDAQSDEGYRAPVSEDLRFTATSTHGDREIGDVAALLQSGAQPTAQVMTVQEERVADEAVPAAEEPAQTPVDPSAMIEIVPEVEPIPETAAALEAKNQAEGGSKADEAADEAADTEVVEDEATPLAATSGAKADDPATEIDVTFDADKNEYVISKDELQKSGGFITNVKAEGLGGAVSANSGNNGSAVNITIDGNAVIAGNATKKNGGAIWMSSEAKGTPATLTVSGNAVIAGNEAGSEPLTDLTKGTIATSQNGGGIYARKNCEVTITGSAVIAGNVANADGGGVYIEGHAKGLTATKNLLTIEENATITNNRSENDRTAKHQKNRSTGPSNEEHFWKNYGGGGGGVFTQDETIINGGQITSNFASDGGGGILALGGNVTIPTKWGGGLDENNKYENALPLLKIENCRISSNYAGTSEGGGICAGTDRNSYIKQGIISNNMTATYFDYGGGGLFMSSIDSNDIKGTEHRTAGITVYHPLVSGNTAAGLGGGVASCTNGVVVSADAAVFGNTAREENCTQNPNEYGDQWVLEGGLHDGEPESYGLKGKIAKGQANDFYCARKSTVFNSMLGGGWYNWTGYTTGDVVSEKANAHREGWNKDNYVKINGTDKVQVTNVLYRSNGNLLRVIVPENDVEKIKQLKGYVVTFDTIDLSKNPSPKVSDTKIVTAIDENPGKEPENDTCSAGEKIVTLYLSKDSVNPADYEAKATGFTLTDAFTTTDPKGNYPLYQVNKLTQTADTCVTGNRLTFLTADPSDEDKAKAEDAAVLFFTGNYSNTHGGGIACNDYIDVGAAGKEPPTKNEDQLGKLTLTKKLTGWNAAEGASATAVFNVTGYADVEAYKAHLAPIYVNQIGFTFNAYGTAEARTLDELPLGYYVVEELFYTGDNFKEATGRNTWTVTLNNENAEEGVSHEFTNTFKDENTFGTGVVNSYAPTGEVTDENGNITGFIYTDGKLTYTPDANYSNPKQPNAPIEGGN